MMLDYGVCRGFQTVMVMARVVAGEPSICRAEMIAYHRRLSRSRDRVHSRSADDPDSSGGFRVVSEAPSLPWSVRLGDWQGFLPQK